MYFLRVFIEIKLKGSIKILFFIIPTDAHYYKIVEMLKQFKNETLAPICFGSHRNQHQGAVRAVHSGDSSFLHSEPHARTTGRYAAIILTASIPTSTIKTMYVVLGMHRTAP
jgi:hypothetical protein